MINQKQLERILKYHHISVAEFFQDWKPAPEYDLEAIKEWLGY